MPDRTSRTLALLTCLTLFLTVAVCAQSYYIFRIHARLGAPEETAGPAGRSAALSVPKGVSPPGDAPDSFFEHQEDAWMSGPDPWSPIQELGFLRDRMDRLFDGALRRHRLDPWTQGSAPRPAFMPNVDVREESDRYVVRVDLPGTDKTNVRVEVADSTLTIAGERQEQMVEREGEGAILRQERRIGRFQRSIPLPGPVESDAVEVFHEDGVLTVVIPKAKEGERSDRAPLR